MIDHDSRSCPGCGAREEFGVPVCLGCGATLMLPGAAARPFDDDDDDEAPRKPVKKPARPPVAEDDDDEPPPRPVKKPAAKEAPISAKKPAPKRPSDDDEDDRPIKKKVSRRDDDDDDDDEDDRPIKKKKVSRRDDEDEADQPASIRDNTLLNMLFPVGVSIWAMLANYCGVGGLLVAVFGGVLAGSMNMKMLGIAGPIAGGVLAFLAIPLGVLSFIIRPKKTTYGGVTGYMRAIIGIICGILGVAAAIAIPIFLAKIM